MSTDNLPIDNQDNLVNQNDDNLYEEFMIESRVQDIIADSSEHDEDSEIREALNDMIITIEREVQHNRRNRRLAVEPDWNASTPTGDNTSNRNNQNANSNANSNNNANPNANPNPGREPLFVQRRPYLRTFLRNLLVLDYAFTLLLFPFSLYNILRFGFSSMTLSNNDFVLDIMLYWHSATNFTSLNNALLLKDLNESLLYKFHNIVLFYSWPACKRMLLDQTHGIWFQRSVLRIYEYIVKSLSIFIYLTYGIGGTLYLTMAGFFFSICLIATIVRRYKNVQRMIAASLEGLGSLPAIF